MRQYLDLLADVMTNGTLKFQRGRTADGQDLRTRAVFGRQVRFDLRDGFPLVTTKKIHFRYIVEELLWFLDGSTNNNDLRARGVTIWDEWAHPETGELGPIYGKQWRRWEGPQGQVDQIAKLIECIHAVKADPRSGAGRRLILTAWNPADMPTVAPGADYTPAPPACHTMSQYDVTEGRLSCQLYQRSADLFLGVPYNIACYATLTHLLAQVTGLEVGEFIHTFGDAHIYENHFDQVREQLSREPRPLPRLILDPRITSLEGLTSNLFRLEGYNPHPAILGAVAV
jgi:thymidylate synthase